jgi:hypothetical protein
MFAFERAARRVITRLSVDGVLAPSAGTVPCLGKVRWGRPYASTRVF